MSTKEEIISNIYYDLETVYGSIRNTYEQANKKYPSIKLEDVQKWMKQQPNKQRKGHRGSNSYTAPFPRFQYQIDIMDMIELQKTTAQPRYALVVIDIFSKFGDVEPMYKKDSDSVLKALKIIFKKMGYPMSIYSDDDGAFKSKVKEFIDGEGINQIVTLTHANVVERFIRTFKDALYKRIDNNKNENNVQWTEFIFEVMLTYNNKLKHSSHEMTPNDARKKSNEMDVNLQLLSKKKT